MYRTIMVPLDGSSLGEYALPLALSIARRSCAAVELVHVCTPLGPNAFGGGIDAPALGETRLDEQRARARAYLDQLGASMSERWEVSIDVAVLDGRAVEALCDHAHKIGADLVVMTTHGYGPLARAWMGSVANQLVRQLPMPVLLVRPHAEALDLLEEVHDRAFERIIIPLDGSALAEQIVEPALELGALVGAEYTLLQSIEVPVLAYAPAAQAAALDEQTLEQWRAEVQAYLEHVAEPLRARGLAVRTLITIAPPAIAIVDAAREQADLIAMSTHGRGGLVRMVLGSVAETVVRRAGVPVLIQRPRVEQAPAPAVAGLAEEVRS
jgi:nucleotide-binding universal stress UspA family protein